MFGYIIKSHTRLNRYPNTLIYRTLSLKTSLSGWKLVPPPSGGVTGNINDSVKLPEPNYFKGAYHWDYERISSFSLIPLTVIPLYSALSGTSIEFPILDAILSSTLLIHSQLGFTSCIVDYIPKRKFGNWHNLAMYMLYFGSSMGLYGVYELETRNNGLIDLISKLWNDSESNVYIFGKY